MSERINFRIPEELLEKVDTTAKISHKNRTELIKDALQAYLQEVENEDEFKEEVVDLYLEDEINFDTLKQFIGRQDAEAVKASKNILENGEDLAEEMANL